MSLKISYLGHVLASIGAIYAINTTLQTGVSNDPSRSAALSQIARMTSRDLSQTAQVTATEEREYLAYCRRTHKVMTPAANGWTMHDPQETEARCGCLLKRLQGDTNRGEFLAIYFSATNAISSTRALDEQVERVNYDSRKNFQRNVSSIRSGAERHCGS